ncbi:cyclic lactone autoinducer peptide [Clostridium sporogenes]
MRSFKMKMGKVLASLALMVTAYNINAACIFLVHQPKMPKGAEKLRKF